MTNLIEKNIITQVDENGELLKEEEKTIYRSKGEESFVKFYMGDPSSIVSVSAIGLLFQMLARMKYDNTVSLSLLDKEEISSVLSIKSGVIDNQLQKLKKQGVIRNVCRGVFKINPFMFARGNWCDIKKKRKEWACFNKKTDGSCKDIDEFFNTELNQEGLY
jgi:hypothetical protein